MASDKIKKFINNVNSKSLFQDSVSDISLTTEENEEIKSKLFDLRGKDLVQRQKEIIDSFEESMGIRMKKNAAPAYKTRTALLNLSKKEEREKFEKILNKPYYELVYMKENWSQFGEFMAFLVFREYTELKNKEIKKEASATAKEINAKELGLEISELNFSDELDDAESESIENQE